VPVLPLGTIWTQKRGTGNWVGDLREAIQYAVALDVLVQAIERAKSAKPKAVTEALHGVRFEGGWTKAMPGGAGSTRFRCQSWSSGAKRELVMVWPSV
jgi:branched-chain amino acid transport system substrate-binding protein